VPTVAATTALRMLASFAAGEALIGGEVIRGRS
jgi:hypothetical protein